MSHAIKNALPLPAITPAGRWIAAAQQTKDSLTIVGMNVLLLVGILLYGVAVPGLVLYFLRWRLVRKKAGCSRRYAVGIWALSIAHEMLFALLFGAAALQAGELASIARVLCVGYALGTVCSIAGLLEAVPGLRRPTKQPLL